MTGKTALLRTVIRACRRRRRRIKVSDSTGAALSGGEVLARAIVLRRLLARHGLPSDDRHVGILLPPTAAAVVANLALTLDRRAVVNLNYSLTADRVNHCIAEADIRRVVTSRRFLDRLPFTPDADLIVLEELAPSVTARDRIVAAVLAFATPLPLLERVLGIDRIGRDDVMTIIFTSGTTGRPKGVVLTFGNVESNVAAVAEVIHLRPHDVLIGVLPFFHAFGFTVTLWTALANDIEAVYHVNPLEGRTVGRLARERRGTILLATPTFLRSYLLRVPAEDFAALEAVVTGGEHLPSAVADRFEERFGIRPVQGYGATETSPLVSANIPPNRTRGRPDEHHREGTVGRPAPGISVRATHLETGEPVDAGERGHLWVRGPNVMREYLNHPEATAEAIEDGWYRTGDVATIDADGFIRIVGRISRFAKIGGEMVPFAPIEEALQAIVGAEEDGTPKAVVTAVPDGATGERLVVLHTALEQSPGELSAALAESGLPALYVPSPASYFQIETMPTIGIGKVNLDLVNAEARSRSRERAEAG